MNDYLMCVFFLLFVIPGLLIAQVYEVQVLAFNRVDGVKLSGPKTEVKSVATADGSKSCLAK